MVSGVLQTLNTVAKGWVRKYSFVSFFYSSTALSNIWVKLDESEALLEDDVHRYWGFSRSVSLPSFINVRLP